MNEIYCQLSLSMMREEIAIRILAFWDVINWSLLVVANRDINDEVLHLMYTKWKLKCG